MFPTCRGEYPQLLHVSQPDQLKTEIKHPSQLPRIILKTQSTLSHPDLPKPGGHKAEIPSPAKRLPVLSSQVTWPLYEELLRPTS